jgi:serine/threonine protein kinase
MSLPYADFADSQYQIQRELGRNREGGRISYLAYCSGNEEEQVVIKQFRFVQSDSSWQGFKAYEREIQFLRELDHPRIPSYLDSFETNDGFCMVQEYKTAPTLSDRRSFTPIEIKNITLSVLEILVDLQERTPSIFHRDIKPENILVDDQNNAYLIDFGLARIEREEMSVSSVVAGTPGFMAPEELFNRPLTKASDLYGLGATIICLISNTRSTDVHHLLDDDYQFKFKQLVSGFNPKFVTWLQRMVAPKALDRFADAKTAMQQLEAIDIGKVNDIEQVNDDNKWRRLFLGTPIVDRADLNSKVKKEALVYLGVMLVITSAIPFALMSYRSTSSKTATDSQVQPISREEYDKVKPSVEWFADVKPHCNPAEIETAMNYKPRFADWEGDTYAAACYALGGEIDYANELIAPLKPESRAKAIDILFDIGQTVADEGNDSLAGPVMELVLKYAPRNPMATYQAGISAYAAGNLPLAKQRLTKFLKIYKAQDGWTNEAKTALNKINQGISRSSQSKKK